MNHKSNNAVDAAVGFVLRPAVWFLSLDGWAVIRIFLVVGLFELGELFLEPSNTLDLPIWEHLRPIATEDQFGWAFILIATFALVSRFCGPFLRIIGAFSLVATFTFLAILGFIATPFAVAPRLLGLFALMAFFAGMRTIINNAKSVTLKRNA